MFSDLYLLPSPLSYAQIRARYRAATGSQEEDGLNYASFLDVLFSLAHLAFPETRGDRVIDKLLAVIRQHLPTPPAHISVALEEENSEDKDQDRNVPASETLSSVVPKLAAFKIGQTEGLEDALSNLQHEAQKKLERLASEFAAKQIELKKQRDAAEQELEDELQVELAQNAVRATKQKRSTTRPSTERLNIEEKLAAIDRSRACRPSRSVVHDGVADKLEQERTALTRRVLALKAAEEDRQIAEAEKEEYRIAKRITSNREKLHRRLAEESDRLDEALHTDMQKKHEEIRTWYLHSRAPTYPRIPSDIPARLLLLHIYLLSHCF